MRTPKASFQSISPGRGCFTSKFTMILNSDWSFEDYREYLVDIFRYKAQDYNSDEFKYINRLLYQVTYRGARCDDVYLDRNEYGDYTKSSKSFYLATTLATQAIFLKKIEGEYNFKIWVEVKVSKIDVDETTGNDIVQCMCKMNISQIQKSY